MDARVLCTSLSDLAVLGTGLWIASEHDYIIDAIQATKDLFLCTVNTAELRATALETTERHPDHKPHP